MASTGTVSANDRTGHSAIASMNGWEKCDRYDRYGMVASLSPVLSARPERGVGGLRPGNADYTDPRRAPVSVWGAKRADGGVVLGDDPDGRGRALIPAHRFCV